MAHQTGIEPTEELMTMFSKALHGDLRFLQVVIENESLVPKKSSVPSGSWEQDLDDMIPPLLTDEDPCYILYRLDDRNVHKNYLWIFMSYIPDYASVKDKMLYAATKATVRKNFSSGTIDDDVAATHKSELTLEGYRKHVESQKAPPPLTDAEHELRELHAAEGHRDIGTSSRQSHLHGISFPIQPDAIDALDRMATKELIYVQLSVDIKNEKITLETTESSLDADSLSQYVPDTSPRYHLYRFHHRYEGDDQEAVVFIYSCPGFKSSVRERMLYSSSKEPVVSTIEQDFKIPVAKKLEIDSGSELSTAALMDEIHPQAAAYRPKFNKPRPPANRRKGTRQNGSNGGVN